MLLKAHKIRPTQHLTWAEPIKRAHTMRQVSAECNQTHLALQHNQELAMTSVTPAERLPLGKTEDLSILAKPFEPLRTNAIQKWQ
jgi:hypothetical protein